MDTTPDTGKNKDLINQLFETVYTKEDLLLFYKEIDQLIALIFTGEGDLEEKMDQIISADKKKSLLSFLSASGANNSDPVSVKEVMSEIENLGNSLPVVTLELSFEPTETIIRKIGDWFLRRTGAKVILDLKLERKIIGGAFIAVNGTYRDYTLRTKIEKYFRKMNQESVVRN